MPRGRGSARGGLYFSLAALYSAYFLVYFHRTCTGVLQDKLWEAARLSGWDPALFASLASSAYFYTYAAMQLPSGILADALGAGRYVALGSALMAAGSALSALGRPELLIAGRLLVGFGGASVWVSLQRVIGTRFGKDRGGLLTGLALAVGGLGSLAATLPARILADAVGLSGLFLVLAALTPVPALVALATVDDRGVGSGSLRRGLGEAVKQVRVVARSPHSIALAVAAFGTYSALIAYQSYWGSRYLTQYFGLSHREAAELLLLTSISFAATVPLVGYFSDSVLHRRKPVLVASCALHTLLWVWSAALAFSRSSELAVLHAVAVGVVTATHSVIAPLSREAFSPEFSGTTLSFVNTLTFAAIAAYQLAGYAVHDPALVMLAFAAFSAAALLLSPWVRETLSLRVLEARAAELAAAPAEGRRES
ncbi:MAG: MFS transporter [Thermofilum sp.]